MVAGAPFDEDALFHEEKEVPAVSVPRPLLQAALQFPAFQANGCARKRRAAVKPDPEAPDLRGLILLPLPVSLETAREFSKDAELRSATVVRKYADFSYHEAVRKVLPPETASDAVPTAFERVGHIAHVNLRAELLPYKRSIGKVIIDKHPGITVVVNKVKSLDSEFREPELEVIAGHAPLTAIVKEAGASFFVDYARVYWNSRLAGERREIVERLSGEKKRLLVCDVAAGVGGFGVLLARATACGVLANDLNPRAVECMQINAVKNKVANRLAVYNLDGREFIRRSLEFALKGVVDFGEQPLAKTSGRKRQRVGTTEVAVEVAQPMDPMEAVKGGLYEFEQVHYLINLPGHAIEFLDAFRGIEAPQRAVPEIFVHCYCFDSADVATVERSLRERVAASLGRVPERMQHRLVRNVAPSRRMYCVEFTVAPVGCEVPEVAEPAGVPATAAEAPRGVEAHKSHAAQTARSEGEGGEERVRAETAEIAQKEGV